MVYIYSHMHVCACIWILTAVLYRLKNLHLWANSRRDFFLLRHRPLLPRPLKPLRGGRVAEGTNSLLPICSFSQQLKSLRSAAISSNLSLCNFGGTGERASQRLTIAICTCTAGGVNCTVTPCSCRLLDPWVIPAVSQLGENWSTFYKDGRTCAELRVSTTNKKKHRWFKQWGNETGNMLKPDNNQPWWRPIKHERDPSLLWPLVNAVWAFGGGFLLQMEIVRHTVCLKTLISAELFIRANVAWRNVSAAARAWALSSAHSGILGPEFNAAWGSRGFTPAGTGHLSSPSFSVFLYTFLYRRIPRFPEAWPFSYLNIFLFMSHLYVPVASLFIILWAVSLDFSSYLYLAKGLRQFRKPLLRLCRRTFT